MTTAAPYVRGLRPALVSPGALLLAGAVILGGFADIPSRFFAGPLSILAWLTGGVALTAWLLWAARPMAPPGCRGLGALAAAYLLWAVFAGFWHPPSYAGWQNLTALAALMGCLMLAAREARMSPEIVGALSAAACWVVVVGAGAYLLQAAVYGAGSEAVFGPRSFSQFAIVALGSVLARWRLGDRKGLVAGVIVLLAIGVSLSRMAFAAAVVLVVLSQLKPDRVSGWARAALITGTAVVVVVLAVTYAGPVRDQFLEGDTSLRVGTLSINASGRTQIWAATFSSYRRSPWIGNGAGSAADLIQGLYGLEHPHGDYLRVLHDFGAVGLALWLCLWAAVLHRQWGLWRKTGLMVHLQGFLASAGVSMGMLTDNAMAYLFVLAPLGVLVGLSLGASSAEAQPPRELQPGRPRSPA